MKTRPFVITWPAPGRLAMMPRPAGGDWLHDDLGALRRGGVDTLVCALTADDQERLQLNHEPSAAAEAGLRYVSFPITDMGVPDQSDLRELAAELAREICAGRYVVAHCFAGIGRSGLIAGAVLIELGATAQQAMTAMTAARGIAAPETSAQRAMLGSLQSSRARRLPA